MVHLLHGSRKIKMGCSPSLRQIMTKPGCIRKHRNITKSEYTIHQIKLCLGPGSEHSIILVVHFAYRAIAGASFTQIMPVDMLATNQTLVLFSITSL
jgi:hypothetical protein